jgi:hypothetical protein
MRNYQIALALSVLNPTLILFPRYADITYNIPIKLPFNNILSLGRSTDTAQTLTGGMLQFSRGEIGGGIW